MRRRVIRVLVGSKDSSVTGRAGLLLLVGQGARILSRAEARNNIRMPELPDLRILAEAFTAALSGRDLLDISVKQPLVLRGTTSELSALTGTRLTRVEQRGKFLLLHLTHGVLCNQKLLLL